MLSQMFAISINSLVTGSENLESRSINYPFQFFQLFQKKIELVMFSKAAETKEKWTCTVEEKRKNVALIGGA